LALRVVFNVSLGFKEFRGNKRAEPEWGLSVVSDDVVICC
jgi:hypothetical protein